MDQGLDNHKCGLRRPSRGDQRRSDGERITVYEQNVERTVHGSLHRPGEEVRISWSPDHTFAVRAEPAATEEPVAAV